MKGRERNVIMGEKESKEDRKKARRFIEVK
jgi:hypothetical protein